MKTALIHLAKFPTPLSCLKYPFIFYSNDVTGLFFEPLYNPGHLEWCSTEVICTPLISNVIN